MTENLPRVTQKIFGGNTETNIGQFGSAKNGSPTRTGDIEQIQALSAWGEGWNAAVIGERDYPALEEMTGVQKVFSQQLAYYFQKGFPEWDAATTYFKNVSFCQLDGIVYQSLTDNNLGNNPSTDSANWTKWNPAGGTFANTDLSNLSPAGQAVLDSKLDNSRISNCILGVTNGLITVNNYSDAAYVNKGCDVAQNVASGFGAAAYILLNKTFTDAVDFTFEIPFKLNTTAGTQYIARINNDKNGFGVQDGVLFLTYDGEQETGTIQLQPNIDYTVKLERNSSTKTYTLALKTTGDYTTHITLNSPSGYYADKSVFLGGGSANYLNGTINLANVQITADSASYWTLASAADFQTVTVSGQYNLLMPDGLNLDQTLNNQNLTISVNQELLYSPGGTKTVLIKNDGEVMIRDGYVISGTEPQDLALSGVWYDNVNNVMQEQSILYANLQLVNPSGDAPAITDGVLNITTDGQYADLAGTADLGQNWNITLNLTSEPSSDGGFIIGAASVSDNSVMPDGIALQYNDGNITAYFRRNDVSAVEKVTVLSTAYIVSKDSGSITGYVQTEGTEGEYVAAETPVYSDQTFETLLENAPADTWTYSGNSVNNTQTTTGYVKAAGEGTFVPPSTQVYTDANCTSEQAVATGTDYTYTGSSAASVIGSLTTTYSDTITMGFNGTQYTLGAQTLSSTDVIRQGCNITLGGAAGVSSAITGINLNTSVFSFWTWNGSTIETPDFIPFVGAKVGTITDNGQTIVSTKIDSPVVLANSDLSNLSDEGEKHFLNKTQITNCLLEVPQRVNVELNSNHQLILKAGSVVIVPYGTSAPTMEIGDTLNGGEIVDISWDGEKLFYYVKSNSDLTAHNSYNSYRLVLMTNDGDDLTDMPTTTTFSQDSPPTEFESGYALWYDTESNIVKYTNNQGSSWTEYYSLPFALMSPYYESIKNIFNGFGFIGSTVWCDKGVKWLLPDGRNTDGSLKNAIQETDKLNLATRTFTVTVPQIVGLSYSEKKINIVSTYYYEQVTVPQVIGTALWYNPLQNLIYYKSNGGSDWILMDIIKIGTIMPLSSTTADSRISVFFKNNTFNALDSNNTEFIAHQAMPGSNYIDLSLPASEGTLVAPADGYVVINADSTTTTSYISLNILTPSLSTVILQDLKMLTVTGRVIATSLPVAKGERIQVGYYGITLNRFRFIYANGSL